MKNIIIGILTLSILGLSSSVIAQKSPSALHEVRSEAEAEKDAWFVTEFSSDWELEAIWLAVRPLGSDAEYKAIAFKRGSADQHIAVVPAQEVQPPGLEYYIVSETKKGVMKEHFASPQEPQPVYVNGDTALTKRAARMERHDDQTSQFELRGAYTAFGSHQVYHAGESRAVERGSDAMWTSEVEYTYRPLTVLYDFSFGLGLMRGSSGTYDLSGQDVSVAFDDDEPGLNYGFGGVTIEVLRNFSVSGKLILGASARGFAVGGATAMKIGQIGGTNLELGAEFVQDIGDRGWMTFAWDTVPRVPMSLTFEVTTQPGPDVNPTGMRFVYGAGWEVSDRVTMLAEIGTATRVNGLSIGAVAGLKARYEF